MKFIKQRNLEVKMEIKKMPLFMWGGMLVLSAYMTWREIENLNKESVRKLRQEIKPRLIQ